MEPGRASQTVDFGIDRLSFLVSAGLLQKLNSPEQRLHTQWLRRARVSRL